MRKLLIILALLVTYFVHSETKDITMYWPKHNTVDKDYEYDFDIYEVNEGKYGEQIRVVMNNVAKSKHFIHFRVQPCESDYFNYPIVRIMEVYAPDIYDNIENIVGVVSDNDNHYYFIERGNDELWKNCFKPTERKLHVILQQRNQPDSVYIVYLDMIALCYAEIGGDNCKIIYYELDGAHIEEAEELKAIRRKKSFENKLQQNEN